MVADAREEHATVWLLFPVALYAVESLGQDVEYCSRLGPDRVFGMLLAYCIGERAGLPLYILSKMSGIDQIEFRSGLQAASISPTLLPPRCN